MICLFNIYNNTSFKAFAVAFWFIGMAKAKGFGGEEKVGGVLILLKVLVLGF
jgi:hypothetical protein